MNDDAAGVRRTLEGLHNAALDVVGAANDADASAEQHYVASLIKIDALHEGTRGGRSADIERYGWLMAVKSTIELIDSNPDLRAHKLSAPLVRLQAALEDLDRGRVHPALRPIKRSRHEKGPRSRLESTSRGHLAGVLEGLMWGTDPKMPERAAARWMQRHLAARGVKLTVEQLEEWRKQVRGARTDDFQTVAYHKVRALDWSDPFPTAARLLEGFLKLT